MISIRSTSSIVMVVIFLQKYPIAHVHGRDELANRHEEKAYPKEAHQQLVYPPLTQHCIGAFGA